MTSWDETLSDNGIMMQEGEAAKALALGVSEKVTLSGSTESFAVLDMCNTVGQKVENAFCDALDTAISVLAPCFEDNNGDAYPSDLSALAANAGIDTVVYGATTGEIRLKNAGAMFDSTYIYQRKMMLNLMVTVHQEEEPIVITPITVYSGERLVNTGYLGVDDSELDGQGVTWTSSDPSVATIDSSTGFVTVVSDGTCTFTATGVADDTKVGNVTVSCLKIMDDNIAANMNSACKSGSSVNFSGVVATANDDGTITMDGTLETKNEIQPHVIPTMNSANTIVSFFPKSGIEGDVLVWVEYLSGTVSGGTSSYAYDFRVRLYDESNTELTAYRLDYRKIPTVAGAGQNILITGSTAGIRRLDISMKWSVGTVFDNYKFRFGVKKYSSQGLIYSGGLIEQYLPALNSFAGISSKRTPISRNPDGSIFIYWSGSMYAFEKKNGWVKLTNGIETYTSRTNIPNTSVIASAGTYKFNVKFIESCTFDSSGSESGAELSFVVLGSDRTQLVTLRHIYQNSYTDTFDANGEAEITFTSNMNITCVYMYYGSVKIMNHIHFIFSLEAAT